jgi:hypothetical protein
LSLFQAPFPLTVIFRLEKINLIVLTPINIPRLDHELQQHPDRQFVAFLLAGLRIGFHTGIQHLPKSIHEGQNLRSARKSPDIVSNSHCVQKSQFHRKPGVIYDETLLSSVKTHSHENSPMILCEIRHVSRIFIDFPESPMNIHAFKRSASIFTDVLVTSMFTGDQRTQFTCFHP